MFYKNASPNLIGSLRKNGKPRTIGARGKRKIYVQYFTGNFKKEFSYDSHKNVNRKLNAKWSKKNPNLKKLHREQDKKRYEVIKKKRSFEAMTGAIVTK